MRYSYEFKKRCVELYRDGKWPKPPEGVKQKRFRDKIREWDRIEEANGPEALKHQISNKNWTPESRYELVAQVLAGKSITSVAVEAGISSGLLYQWVRKYKTMGYNGLAGLWYRCHINRSAARINYHVDSLYVFLHITTIPFPSLLYIVSIYSFLNLSQIMLAL